MKRSWIQIIFWIMIIIIMIVIIYVVTNTKETYEIEDLKIGIATLTKNPIEYDKWLSYQFDVLKIDYIFIQIEDTPNLKDEIYSKYTTDEIFINDIMTIDIKNQYEDLQKRQMKFLQYCIEQCKQKKIQFLLHIDDDELLYVSKENDNNIKNLIIKKKLITSLLNYTDFHFKNIEAVYPDDISNCFQTQYFIDCYKDQCRSYANGKSMGRISSKLRPNGPHHFNGHTLKISDNDACILHFDSCNFKKWKQKFTNLANLSKKELKKIPFSYYRNSILKIYDCQHQCSESSIACKSCNDEMKNLWKSFTSDKNKKFIKTIIHPLS